MILSDAVFIILLLPPPIELLVLVESILLVWPPEMELFAAAAVLFKPKAAELTPLLGTSHCVPVVVPALKDPVAPAFTSKNILAGAAPFVELMAVPGTTKLRVLILYGEPPYVSLLYRTIPPSNAANSKSPEPEPDIPPALELATI